MAESTETCQGRKTMPELIADAKKAVATVHVAVRELIVAGNALAVSPCLSNEHRNRALDRWHAKRFIVEALTREEE